MPVRRAAARCAAHKPSGISAPVSAKPARPISRVARDLAARDNLCLPHIEPDPGEERDGVHMLQRLERVRTCGNRPVIGQREAEEDDDAHDERRTGKELRPLATDRGRRGADRVCGHVMSPALRRTVGGACKTCQPVGPVSSGGLQRRATCRRGSRARRGVCRLVSGASGGGRRGHRRRRPRAGHRAVYRAGPGSGGPSVH